MVVLGGGAFSYERGTPVLREWASRAWFVRGCTSDGRGVLGVRTGVGRAPLGGH